MGLGRTRHCTLLFPFFCSWKKLRFPPPSPCEVESIRCLSFERSCQIWKSSQLETNILWLTVAVLIHMRSWDFPQSLHFSSQYSRLTLVHLGQQRRRRVFCDRNKATNKNKTSNFLIYILKPQSILIFFFFFKKGEYFLEKKKKYELIIKLSINVTGP